MSRSGKTAGVAVVFAVLVVLSWVVTPLWYFTMAYPEYQRAVHGHVENAYYSDTPELIIANLEKARDGMRSLGLEEDDYWSLDWTVWHQTPDRRMDFQYELVDGVIERAHDVIEWRDQHRSEQAGEFSDVYEQKVMNIRSFIKDADGWMDDIAYGAWKAGEHPVIAGYWVVVILESIVFAGIVGVAVVFDHRDRYRRRRYS